jgi:transposase
VHSVQDIGRTKGGRNTQVHAISDQYCRPLAFYLTPGQAADIIRAVMLANHLPPDPARYLLADKVYDADHWRAWLIQRKTEPVIPNKANRKQPYAFNWKRYRRRNVFERMFGRLKDFRRIASPYDKNVNNFMVALSFAARGVARLVTKFWHLEIVNQCNRVYRGWIKIYLCAVLEVLYRDNNCFVLTSDTERLNSVCS